MLSNNIDTHSYTHTQTVLHICIYTEKGRGRGTLTPNCIICSNVLTNRCFHRFNQKSTVCVCVCLFPLFLLYTASQSSPYVLEPYLGVTLASMGVPFMYLCVNKLPMENRGLEGVICPCGCLLLQQGSGFCATTEGHLL